ncbi:DUF899 family protein [Allokutzneria oryzae]|uniref:DUF899 family protein n=1 Tax=Allokutzneria oryzae TaxID=1378989 RepID=A0ABV6A788_9PSEU
MNRIVRPADWCSFQGPGASASLLDLFAGRPKLVLCGLPGEENGSALSGPARLVGDVLDMLRMHVRDTTLALVSACSVSEIAAAKNSAGWNIPWVASHGFGLVHGPPSGHTLTLDAFAHYGMDVHWTYTAAVQHEGDLLRHLRTCLDPENAWPGLDRAVDEVDKDREVRTFRLSAGEDLRILRSRS